MLDATKVYIGLADQATTGAVLNGPVVVPENIPADINAAEPIIADWRSSGYVSEDGASLSTDLSTTDIKEWNKAGVRTLLDEFTGTVTLTLIQADYDGWAQALGEDHVDRIPATAEHGEQLHVHIGANLPAPRGWALKMKDGDARMMVFIPNGQVASSLDITFAADQAIGIPLTINCHDDGTGSGDMIHILTDDGVVSAGAQDNTPNVHAVDPTDDTGGE